MAQRERASRPSLARRLRLTPLAMVVTRSGSVVAAEETAAHSDQAGDGVAALSHPDQQAPAQAAAASARPYVDLPISIGRLRVLRGFQTLSWALAVVWIFVIIHPDLGLAVQRKISYDENAVSPANPLPVTMTQEHLAPYLTAAVGEALGSATKSEADWFADSLTELGLAPTEHLFDCAGGGPYTHLLPPQPIHHSHLMCRCMP